MTCDPTKFNELQFCVSHIKNHGVPGLNKHYYLQFDPKLGQGICRIILKPLCVWHVSTCWANTGPLVYHTLNNPDTILLWTAHTVLCWSYKISGTSSISPITIHLKENLMGFIWLSLMASVKIWSFLCRQVNMVPSV